MNNTLLYALGGSLCLGIAAQWLAARLRWPAILVLLVVGILAGPVAGWLDPSQLGPILQPMVALSVALILFEGGLSLKLADLRGSGAVVVRLVSVGTVVTLVLITLVGWCIGLSPRLALLVGAILVVTGPTVVGPLLHHVRPRDPVAAILRWEGIIIDPIGAMLALAAYELMGVPASSASAATLLVGLGQTVVVGALVGGVAAALVYTELRRHLVPDELQGSVVLMVVVAAYLASQALHTDSGLFTVTFMGIVLANQSAINVKHITDFKENLRVLLLSFLFVNLSAGLHLGALLAQLGPDCLFLAALVLVVRPAAVLVATLGSQLTRSERLFMAWMAPRGIVAASIASVFGLRMAALHDPQADRIVPLVFVVIIGTVAVYGSTAQLVGRWLGVVLPEPQGVLIAGAHVWARDMALALRSEGLSVVVVDTNPDSIRAARMQGLPVVYGSVLSSRLRDELPADIGHLLALTPNDEVNALATLHWSQQFGRARVYQLAPAQQPARLATDDAMHLRGRFCFADHLTFQAWQDAFAAGATIKTTHLTVEFAWTDFQRLHGESAVPLFVVSKGQMTVATPAPPIAPQAGDSLVYASLQPRATTAEAA